MSAQQPFGRVLQSVMLCKDLSSTARLVYAILTTYARGGNLCYPSRKTIAEAVGKSQRTISTALAQLEEYGVISRHIQQGKPTAYELLTLAENFNTSTLEENCTLEVSDTQPLKLETPRIRDKKEDINPPTPRAQGSETREVKSSREKPWPADYLPVRDLWESIHNGEAIGPYDATQLIELTNKHGPALVTAGLEWMGDEGKRKMTHLKDYLRRGEAPATVAPTASVEKHHGSGKQSGSTGYSEPKRKGYISAERGAELDRQYDEVGAEYRAMVARGADETPALAGYRDATGSVRSIPGMVDPTRIH